jgi:hypothetical protein
MKYAPLQPLRGGTTGLDSDSASADHGQTLADWLEKHAQRSAPPPPAGRSPEAAARSKARGQQGPHPGCSDPRGLGGPRHASGARTPKTRRRRPTPRRARGPRSQSQRRGPSCQQGGGDRRGSARAALPLAEAAPPRQRGAVLQSLRLCGCGPGPGPLTTPASPRPPTLVRSSSFPSPTAHKVSCNSRFGSSSPDAGVVA